MTPDFTKTVRPGTVPTHGGARMSVYCRIEYKDGRLSISGVEGPTSSGNARGSAGQIDMHYSHRNGADNDLRSHHLTAPEDFNFTPGWDAELWLDFLDIWKRWHLNHMQAGCEHQRALGWAEAAHEKITLYRWRLKRAVTERLEAAEKSATAQLRRGETVRLAPEIVALSVLPKQITTATDEPPSEEYEPNGPLYSGDRYNRPTETKTRGAVRPDEHPDGLLTAPCPECGYLYGSAWRRADVPADVLDFLSNLPDADRAPAWV